MTGTATSSLRHLLAIGTMAALGLLAPQSLWNAGATPAALTTMWER